MRQILSRIEPIDLEIHVSKFEQQKHIVLIIRVLGGRSGGAERIFCELANMLCSEKYIVTCLTYEKINRYHSIFWTIRLSG